MTSNHVVGLSCGVDLYEEIIRSFYNSPLAKELTKESKFLNNSDFLKLALLCMYETNPKTAVRLAKFIDGDDVYKGKLMRLIGSN